MAWLAPRKQRTAINLTPLIDVLFILIIFFTVSSTWRERPGLDLDLPDADSATAEETSHVTVSISEAGRIFLDGEEASADSISMILADRLSGDRKLIIAADRLAPHGVVVSVLDAARAQGSRKVIFATDSGR